MRKIRDGVWKRGSSYYVHTKINGVLIRKSFGPNKQAAQLAVTELKKQKYLALVTNDWSGMEKLLAPKNQTTFEEAAGSYMAEHQLKHSSKLAYEDRLKQLLPEFGSKAISEITEEQIARFQTRLANKLSPSRVNAIVNLLRIILKTCTRRGLIDKNPADGVSSVRTEQVDVDPLTRNELKLVLSKISPYFQEIFTCLAWTGARPGELKALRWSDIDWQRNEIKISKSRYNEVESTTKTKSSNRIITMLQPVRDCLTALKDNSQVLDLERHVFLGKDGKPIDRHLDRTWAVALQNAGLRHRPSYQLRHTFASILLQEGEQPGWIAKQLGHTNLQTTFRHYARFIDDNQRTEQRISKTLFEIKPKETASDHKKDHRLSSGR